jgi:diguanylate cyclase (GGDEF)-like protein
MLMVVAIAAVAARGPWFVAAPATLALWLAAGALRGQLYDQGMFTSAMLVELPGVIVLAGFAFLSRQMLGEFEQESVRKGASSETLLGIDPATGVYDERHLRSAIEAELTRARRFSHEFAFVLVGVDERRQRFDYSDEEFQASFGATATLLRGTRTHIDRVFRFGADGFALILPESGEREVRGLVRRLRRVARDVKPPEGEPGVPLPVHFGATFFPQCATTVDDLLRRAEIAMKLAEKTVNRLQIDGAEAPDMPAPETLRREAMRSLDDGKPAMPATVTLTELEAAIADGGSATEAKAEASGRATADSVEAAAKEPVGDDRQAVQSRSLTLASAAQEEKIEAAGARILQFVAPSPDAPATAPASSEDVDDAFSELLRHMDETLGLIKNLKSAS